jgi:hypothetical protein
MSVFKKSALPSRLFVNIIFNGKGSKLTEESLQYVVHIVRAGVCTIKLFTAVIYGFLE